MTPGICNAPRAYLETLPFLALPLCLHVGKRGVSALLQGQLDAQLGQSGSNHVARSNNVAIWEPTRPLCL
jgi:hypothetical protein